MAFSAIYDLTIDERDVRIYSNGTGDPVLSVPDLGSSAATWECLTHRVCDADRQLVAIDLPGAGHSAPVRGSELPAFVDHLRRVVEHPSTDPVDVLGCGFGAYWPPESRPRTHSWCGDWCWNSQTVPPRSGPPVSSRMSPGMALNGAVTTLRRGKIKQNVHGFSRASAVLAQLARADPRWWESLAQITAPTLIIGAGSDDVGQRALLDLLAAAIPGAARADLGGSRRGHASDPDSFAAVVMPFLTR